MQTLTPPPSTKRKRGFDDFGPSEDDSPLGSVKTLPTRPLNGKGLQSQSMRSKGAGEVGRPTSKALEPASQGKDEAAVTNNEDGDDDGRQDATRHSFLRSPKPSKKKAVSKHLDEAPGLWWSDSEITGHQLDPQDPADDGYGINGIGFVQTPANAFARARKREKQIQSWRERESREARIQRGDRRRQRLQGVEAEAIRTVEGSLSIKRVRFLG